MCIMWVVCKRWFRQLTVFCAGFGRKRRTERGATAGGGSERPNVSEWRKATDCLMLAEIYFPIKILGKNEYLLYKWQKFSILMICC